MEIEKAARNIIVLDHEDSLSVNHTQSIRGTVYKNLDNPLASFFTVTINGHAFICPHDMAIDLALIAMTILKDLYDDARHARHDVERSGYPSVHHVCLD